MDEYFYTKADFENLYSGRIKDIQQSIWVYEALEGNNKSICKLMQITLDLNQRLLDALNGTK